MFHLTETYTDSEEEEDINIADETNKKDSLDFNLNERRPKFTKLVSYHDIDETFATDEETETFDVENELESSENNLKTKKQEEESLLPPEPVGKCSPELQDKISKIFEKMKSRTYDMNEVIQMRKDFRNPSIYEKLVEYCSINEFGTNYEPHMYNPLKWNKNSFYDELARIQRQDLEQRMKELKKKVKKTGVIVQHINNVMK